VLRLSAASVRLDEVDAMTAEDHRQAFTAYVAGLLGDFDRYLARGDVDLLRDQVSYRLAAMWLDDTEFAELRRELARVLQPRLANPPSPGRTRRILASILLPRRQSCARPATTTTRSQPHSVSCPRLVLRAERQNDLICAGLLAADRVGEGVQIETSLLSRGFGGFLWGRLRGCSPVRGGGPWGGTGLGSGLSEEPVSGV
jgi:hypothetical protein